MGLPHPSAKSFFTLSGIYPPPRIQGVRIYLPGSNPGFGIYLGAMKQRGVKMDDEMWARVQAQAKKEGQTAGEYVRQAVQCVLDGDADFSEPDKVVVVRTGEELEVTAVPGKPISVPKKKDRLEEAREVLATAEAQVLDNQAPPDVLWVCPRPRCDSRPVSQPHIGCPYHPGFKRVPAS